MFWSSRARKNRVIELKTFLAEALEKLATAEGYVKKLDAEGQEPEKQTSNAE